MNVTHEGIGSGDGTGHEDLLAALLSKLAAQNEQLTAQSEQLAAQNAKFTEQSTKLAEVCAERDAYRHAYEKLKEELLLVKRRLFIASAERVDTTQLELEFAELSKKLDALGGQVPAETEAERDTPDDAGENAAAPSSETTKRKPTGRRNLAEAELPEETVELADDLFEQLVADGKAERIGFETSYRLRRLRGGMMRVAVKRVKYRAVDSRGQARIETTPLPPELLRRGMAAPSLLAHVAVQKFCDGLPLFRIEDRTSREGFRIDRGTMSRWMEELGATVGATVVHAMNEDALSRAFCIATDATGFAVQPGPQDRAREGPASQRRPCRKGHYFVRIADRDHIFFEFRARHTTRVVRAMFQGFEGYVQADAATVYDALFRSSDDEHDGKVRHEVACWSHARRKYWEAAFAKEPIAREALLRVHKIFVMDAECRGKRRPPSKIRSLRQAHLRPLIEDFLAFAEREYAKVEGQRSSLRSALGYTVRQQGALRAFLDDGRLRMDNNRSERELRKVVRIRDASLFAGSDEHAEAAGHILSLIASARLHNLDPEQYLRDLIRVLPHWPKDRLLELSPLHWALTRRGLESAQLAAELGPLHVPAPAQ